MWAYEHGHGHGYTCIRRVCTCMGSIWYRVYDCMGVWVGFTPDINSYAWVQQIKMPHLQASYVQQTWTIIYQIEMQLNPQPQMGDTCDFYTKYCIWFYQFCFPGSILIINCMCTQVGNHAKIIVAKIGCSSFD